MRPTRCSRFLHALLLAAICCTVLVPCEVPGLVAAALSGDVSETAHHPGVAFRASLSGESGAGHVHAERGEETAPCGDCCNACLLCGARYAQIAARPSVAPALSAEPSSARAESAPRSRPFEIWKPPRS